MRNTNRSTIRAHSSIAEASVEAPLDRRKKLAEAKRKATDSRKTPLYAYQTTAISSGHGKEKLNKNRACETPPPGPTRHERSAVLSGPAATHAAFELIEAPQQTYCLCTLYR